MSSSDTTATASNATRCLMISPAEDFTHKSGDWHLVLQLPIRPHRCPDPEWKTADRWRGSCLPMFDLEICFLLESADVSASLWCCRVAGLLGLLWGEDSFGQA